MFNLPGSAIIRPTRKPSPPPAIIPFINSEKNTVGVNNVCKILGFSRVRIGVRVSVSVRVSLVCIIRSLLTPSGELMLVGMENSVSLPLLSIPVDGQKWQTGLFSVRQGRKITPSVDESIYAVHQLFSGFNTGGWADCIQHSCHW